MTKPRLVNRDLLIVFCWPLILLFAVQLASYGIDLARYRRISSFHTNAAKLWGLALYLAAVALLGFHTADLWLWLVIGAGFLANAEALAIKAILPTWQHDVPSLFHALRIRGEEQSISAHGRR